MTYYAHTNGSEQTNWQTIKEHLENTAELALKLGVDTGLSEFAYVAAIYHDIGKYSQDFQHRLTGGHLKVDHSTAGAQEVIRLFQNNRNQELISTMLAYCIAGHHSGLPDNGSNIDIGEEGTLWARRKKSVKDYQAYAEELNPSNIILPNKIPIRPIKNYAGYSLAFFTRMVYSILVDADYLETESFLNQRTNMRGGYKGIEILCGKFNKFLERFDHPTTQINQQRTNSLKECVSKAAKKPGLFTLTIPTGGGKTFASMAFALNHARIHGLGRIIYIIPYTSIIEQNAAEFKKCLGVENVLEHHSNFDWDGKEDKNEIETRDDQTNNATEKLKLAAENWDIPIVVTTNVQFFESLYSNRSSRCRKIHNMAKSVLIFDEAQMLPTEYLKPCIYAIYELVKNYGATAIFCTATQPSLQQFLPEEAQIQELATEPRKLYEFYKRVRVNNTKKLPDSELINRLNEHPQVLCIVNTRKHARGLFEAIINDGRFHLSTWMCPAHRKETIKIIREHLKKGEPCRVVSTQIMEAGIDVDFPVGYRAIAGLDSIIQAAGRVNREGRNMSGALYVFEPDSAFVKKIPGYIKQGAEVAGNILRNYDDPVCLQAIDDYYNLLYDIQGENTFDASGILGHFEKRLAEPDFDFKTAAEKFRLIKQETLAVIIPYDDAAKSLLKQIRSDKFPYTYSRKLQLYTTNIYEQEFQALQSLGAIDIYGGVYAVLNDMQYYHPETGFCIPETDGGQAIFFDG